jgi:hypothetical protein
VLTRIAITGNGSHAPFRADPNERTPELDLLLCCARTELDPGQRDRLVRATDRVRDWGVLFTLAEFHGLLPLLHKHLAQLAACEVPEMFRTRCKAEVARMQWDVLGKCADLLGLLDRFAEERIPVLSFKGAVAGAAYYGDPGLRPFNDADLLVRVCQARRAWDLLLQIGYAPTIPLTPGWRAVDIRSRNERMFIRKGRPVVDLHWNLMPLYYTFTPSNDAMWQRAERVTLAGRPIATLGPEDALIFFCLHGAKHSWSKLRWVCDVAQLAQARPDLHWEQVLSWAERHGASRMVQIGLRLAHDLLQTPVPPAAWATVRRDPEVERLVNELRAGLLAFPPRPEPEAEFPWHSVFFQCMDRCRDRARWVYEVILLPGEMEWAMLPLPSLLAPLYYPVRMSRLGWKHVWKQFSTRAGKGSSEYERAEQVK